MEVMLNREGVTVTVGVAERMKLWSTKFESE
jgi:hypothetical protein